LRSTVVAHFEGGGVEVDGGSATMTKSLRMRTVVACSEAEVKAAACSGARIENGWWRRWRGDF
jgi:hypothetical protein